MEFESSLEGGGVGSVVQVSRSQTLVVLLLSALHWRAGRGERVVVTHQPCHSSLPPQVNSLVVALHIVFGTWERKQVNRESWCVLRPQIEIRPYRR